METSELEQQKKIERLQSLILKAADHIEDLGDAMTAVLLREAAK